jgi:hypothetical protein
MAGALLLTIEALCSRTDAGARPARVPSNDAQLYFRSSPDSGHLKMGAYR